MTEKLPLQAPIETIAKAMAKPLVSAIIPTYNRAGMLARAIRSVQRQTYPHLEIIVVDDASQGNTHEIVERFGDPRIRYIRHDTNRGGSAARNTGIRAATGQFIAFLDDDDEWEPKKTEEQVKVLENYNAVICATDTGGSLRKPDSKKTVGLDDLRRGPWGGTGVLMARAAVLKQLMFDESLPRGQDWDLFIRVALTHKIAYLNKPLLRHGGGSHPRITNSIRNIPITELEEQFRVVHKYKELFGLTWFKHQMCRGLLYGIKDRRHKLALLTYTARRYGLRNVMRTLISRVRTKFVNSVRSTVRVSRDRRMEN